MREIIKETEFSNMNKRLRAHDLAVSMTKWQLDHINIQNATKDQPVKINVYAIYKKNCRERPLGVPSFYWGVP
jgi:hypothetical protein